MSEPILLAESVSRVYREGGHELKVLDNLNFALEPGERVAIVGQSGSGKSTLLNILGGLDVPSSGRMCVGGKDLHEQSEKNRARIRNEKLGFVYQFHHLLPEFSALENVAMPLLLRGDKVSDIRERAAEMLAAVGLSERVTHKPAQLSGGERQRVAIARSLIGQPACVLMDEPTGNLDRKTADDVQLLIEQLNRTLNIAFVIVTHDLELAHRTGRVFELRDGGLFEQQAESVLEG
ncbi:lipoprotein-releasing ABC transporter ATP-binding protein LolD [Pontibacterium sp. N1Y112]|uniref:Lipoprotein-releasing system ATP-binding protein LolD n=1 Tax=Pontibacterium sinense TaxID=2781979 RepID=A0A8J7FCL1_9GAMM|nr:lipoprotein-releasing ABC transporter ATP-binding protein LolD [Pontibacterium sinense]MBE9397221.1 lipoprotein-releasing ABC transporter ATP-binding protein LolD [Pontibacterium sinense]